MNNLQKRKKIRIIPLIISIGIPLLLGGITAVARASKEDLKRVGEEFSFVINVNKMHFFDMETEENIMY